ncbi:RNA polymerase factor sigma-70 [Pseudomonas sp. HR96]|uniref:RNA polymerase factor sigma-70 n=1 Tax=Pseudomonas sp. HR96 TaxID=1027966 RepID=UPI002A74D8DC|nr:RNA polymerase factor sigma-70 [Pseudomonas sp. HR96]WPP02035.1 RNA polymerase factor sigma-70 [Pseudomonas sp. HR96]
MSSRNHHATPLPVHTSLSPVNALFLDNYPLLVKVAMRITGCRSYAEDVVQDAFIRLNRSPMAATVKSQVSYLFQVVRNLSIDHYRKQILERRYAAPAEEGLDAAIASATPEAIHDDRQTLALIDVALAQLPQRTRYAFEMYRIHGRPQKELAAELGVSPTLVNFMIRDAQVHCHQAVQAHG